MSQEPNQKSERTDYPIERGFPIERVNEIAGREGHGGARRYYRPIYAMHKWWARRLGSVFRSIYLYSLIDEDADVEVFEPGQNGSLSENGGGTTDIEELVDNVDIDNPDSLWPLYNKDVRVRNKRVLDPFMGGGTSIVEASRFGANVAGYDLNPVAWFVVKKELDTGSVELEELEKAYNLLETKISNELRRFYKTPCPSCGEKADVMYYLWVKELDCVSCNETVSLFRDYRIGKARYGDDGYNVLCPECESIVLSDDWRSDTTCSECGHSFVPENGNLEGGSQYSCRSCGQKYSATDAVSEQDGYNKRLYAIEYHCPHCESRGKSRGESKGYKAVEQADIDLWEDAVDEWDSNTELREYVPNYKIRPGWKTASSEFEGSAPGAGDLRPHGITKWTDMFNKRQLLTLSKLLKAIDELNEEGIDKSAQEFALLVFSDILRTNTMMTGYTPVNNTINQIFKTNSFDPPHQPAEGNPWGAKFGYATFQASWKTMKSGVEWGKSPTERYVEDGETEESPSFNYPVGKNTQVRCRDMNEIDEENVVDAVITDPPYYDNVLYSELSDYFYVWQRIVLADEYEWFEPLQTPRSESVVANPAEGKDVDDFEKELKNSFGKIRE
ncbi:MAG: DNA methyltransferase, partial [Halobacteriaceae archaeon]